MNIMLVEDEPPILRELTGYIEGFGEPFRILCTALDGQHAREAIDRYGDEIDFLLTDIQIPMMNGLELVAYVKKTHPQILCSILTGYNEFRYAQTALRLQVMDYISKPIDEEELRRLLQEAYEKKCLSSLSQPKTVEAGHADAVPGADASLRYEMALVNLGQLSYKTDYPTADVPEEDLAALLERTLSALPDGCVKWWTIQDASRRSCYILFSFTDAQLPQSTAFFRRIYEALRAALPCVTFACSRLPISVANIKEQMRALSQYMSRRILFARSAFLLQEDEEPLLSLDKRRHEALLRSIRRLSGLLPQCQPRLFHAELTSFFELLQSAPVRQETLTELLLALFTECTVSCFQYGAVRSLRCNDIVEDAILLSTSWAGLQDNLTSIFDDLCATIADENGSTNSKMTVLLQIDRYIQEHYAEAVNTQSIARRFGFTPAYLSKLFRDYRKVTPAEYVTALRISRAKELLAGPQPPSVKEVAAFVGYDDPLYFSKVFKKETGVSPKNYRRE